MEDKDVYALTMSILALVMSIVSGFIAIKSNVQNKKFFLRQGVIELHMAWRDMNDLNVHYLVTADVVRAVNALNLTASLWNHDVMEKNIIHQSYWDSFQVLYDQINSIHNVVPGLKKTGPKLLSPDIRIAYEQMQKFELKKVKQTKI